MQSAPPTIWSTWGRAQARSAARSLPNHAVTPELEIEWRKASEKFYPQIRSKLVPEDIFAEVERLLKEHRATGGQAKP